MQKDKQSNDKSKNSGIITQFVFLSANQYSHKHGEDDTTTLDEGLCRVVQIHHRRICDRQIKGTKDGKGDKLPGGNEDWSLTRSFNGGPIEPC
jgi:hypothetical protein